MTIYWDDELEEGNNGFDLETVIESHDCGGLPWGQFDTTNKVSGNASIQMNFPDSSGQPGHANSAPGDCGGFTDRSLGANPTELYTRFYLRLSPGFDVDIVTTKIPNNLCSSGSCQWVMHDGGPWLGCVAQIDGPDGNSVNYYDFTPLTTDPEGGFVLIQTRIKLNDVGQANGIIQAWIDEVLTINESGLELRSTGLTFNAIRLYRQHGNGELNYDRLAAGDEFIGAIEGGGSAISERIVSFGGQAVRVRLT